MWVGTLRDIFKVPSFHYFSLVPRDIYLSITGTCLLKI